MASFFRCDRCKNEAIIYTITIPATYAEPFHSYGNHDDRQETVDLCSSCLMSFRNWWTRKGFAGGHWSDERAALGIRDIFTDAQRTYMRDMQVCCQCGEKREEPQLDCS